MITGNFLDRLHGGGFNPPYVVEVDGSGAINGGAWQDCDLRGFDFSKKSILCQFVGCDLRGAEFVNCTFPALYSVGIVSCDVSGARFVDIDVKHVRFQRTDIRRARFQNVAYRVDAIVDGRVFGDWVKFEMEVDPSVTLYGGKVSWPGNSEGISEGTLKEVDFSGGDR